MKRLFLICLVCLAAKARAQKADIAALGSRCVPAAPASTLDAIIGAESSGNPNAMQIDFPKSLLRRWHLPNGTLRLRRQPSSQREALDWLAYLQRFGIFVDLGLMQVSTAEAQRRGLPAESLLEPCTNLRVGWEILEEDYRIEMKTYGPGQDALRHAISRYNTGDSNRGMDNGYLVRVLAARRSLDSTFASTAK
jgi:type IV secretion system protein VirB1